MKAKIRLLEQRVQDVVDRLQTLTQERDRLSDELRSLEQRIEAAGAAGAQPEAVERLDRIEGALRDAIADLRGE